MILINKKLEGINPYDENLTEEQKKDIIEECKNNIIYFLNKIVGVQTDDYIETVIHAFLFKKNTKINLLCK